jgi:arginyl-tRNA synthetase
MFLAFKQETEQLLKQALANTSFELSEGDLELVESEHADLSSRVAFSLARRYHRSPAHIAAEIVQHLELPTDEETLVATVDAVGPYINFSVNDRFLQETLRRFKSGEPFAAAQHKKIILEHTSANPDGPLHIGHLRNAIIGDVLTRVFRCAGYEVETQYYLNDMGRQIAVVVWGAERMAYDDRKKADHAVAEVYIAANRRLEAQPELSGEVEALMRRYEAGDAEIVQKYDAAVNKCLEGIKDSLKRLKIEHDVFVWESDFVRGGAVKEVIEELKQKGEIKHEGTALLLQLEGIEKALVIQRADGTSLYTTRDLAYHRWKGERCDRVIDVFGKDHELVTQQLAKALEILGVRVPEFVIFAFVSLPTGSLSTRAGRYISADELIEKIVKRAYTEVAKRRDDLTEEAKRAIARKVGIGALRYDMVKVSPDKHILFDFDEALDIEKKGAPFIQYAHARACSILRAAQEKGCAVNDAFDASLLRHEREIALIKQLSRFSYAIEAAAADLKTHQVAKYARELAESFNLFYKECPVLTAEEELRRARLALVDCSRIVLQAVLAVLGIEAPEEM